MNPIIVYGYRTLIAIPLLNRLFQKIVERTIPKKLERFGVILSVNPSDTAISLALHLNRYEPDDVKIFQSMLRPGLMVADIGANIGIYTAVAAKAVGSNGRVFAFEPESKARTHLLETIQLNQFPNVRVIDFALSDHIGYGQLSRNLFNCGDNSLHGKRHQVPVKVITLDSVFIDQNFKLDLIKIDVQGAELEVLKGGEQTLRRDHPAILMEMDRSKLAQAKTSPEEVEKFLSSLGYVKVLAPAPLKPDNLLFISGSRI